jgi:hypothetical protein
MLNTKNIAADIFRQRLLIEGFYTISVTKLEVENYLLQLADTLNLRTYGKPTIFSPASGMGSEENMGYDAFLPLIDSGIALYVWSKKNFMSTVLYTCKGFEPEKALDFTKNFFKINSEIISLSF